ncbi:MAG: NTP transferase domain-containing protein [Elusimicrobiaceae bacterium]|nr:NTP transferase domain-containing protein [Elusimicrobiaceae bacterium]
MKCNVIIPMAGAGSRFRASGYALPKPFIEFEGKMMIEHVLASFSAIQSHIILVLQEKFLEEQKEQLAKIQQHYPIDFVTVPKLTMGAAITALAAHKKIDPNFDLLFADSDNIFSPKDVKDFLINVRERDLAGAMLTFFSNKPCFSYAKTNEEGYLIETKEKEVISCHAIAGMYYFKALEVFKDAVIDMIVEADLSKGEFYMSNVFNHLKKFTSQIGLYDIEHFDCVGTPEQLNEYLKRNHHARIQ